MNLFPRWFCRVGNLRFQPPQPPAPKSGTQAADSYGAACPQQIVAPVQGIQLLPAANNSSEDCKSQSDQLRARRWSGYQGLFINVIRPSNVPTGELLPVIFVSFRTSCLKHHRWCRRCSGFTMVRRWWLCSLGRTYDYLSLGGFTDGDSSQHPGNPVVQRSIALGQPVIYVSHNFRLNGKI